MKKKNLIDRVNELPNDTGKNLGELADLIGMHRQQLYLIRSGNKNRNTNLRTLERLGYGIKYIPIVIYRKSDLVIEDLGIRGFLFGNYDNNYIGKVWKKHRLSQNLTQEEFARKLKIKSKTYKGYETGRHKPPISTIESAHNELGLGQAYLVPPLSKC